MSPPTGVKTSRGGTTARNRVQKRGPPGGTTPSVQASKSPNLPEPHAWGIIQRTLLGVTLVACGVYFIWTTTIQSQRPLRLLGSNGSVPFSVVDLPGRGKGIVATRDIQQGELVLREKPLFVVSSSVTGSPGALLLDMLSPLTEEQRASFYNLSYVYLPQGPQPGTRAYDEALALAIFQTNAVSAGQHVGIFPQMARLNHGCSSAFNSVYTWRDREGMIVVHALKPVKEGEELLTTYTDTKRPRDARRQFLEAHYGFRCGCSVCSLPPEPLEASDRRLSAMADLYQRFSWWQHGRVTGLEAEGVASEIWAIGEEEGYWSERGRLAADVAWVAAAHSDANAARQWAILALRWYSYELGSDSVQAEEMRTIVARPEEHPAWASRPAETLRGPGMWSSGDV